ncbi:MAG TPA: Stp1/IreP family PP2C-type Ser/Thr phosphatase [Gaiellaceae bacterium]|nr:Stp1/IreP family PP2C-type Ser/Thr phosphatase [Gaiellaceae bacterium]
MRSAVATDPGRRRRHNEDAYVCEPPLYAIADGMGGAQAGEVASGLAAAVLSEGGGSEQGEERVGSLIQEANRRVFRRSSEDAAASGMGTTMTVALVDRASGTIALGHVGDSRAYRVRGGELEQLTDDHSLVGELVRSGKLSAEEAEVHPQRSVITRAVGTEPEVDVDTFTVEAEPGDLYLLCSDGLTDMVADREILSVLADADDLDRAARALVDAANEGGGEDNITLVLFAVDEDDPAGDAVGDTVGDTVTMPALAEPEEDDEDTLSGLDPVPAVDTAVVPAEAIREHLERTQPEAAAQPPRRRRSVVPLAVLVLLLFALILLAIWGLYR